MICKQGRPTLVAGSISAQPGVSDLAYAHEDGSRCLGPACESPRPISDTSRLEAMMQTRWFFGEYKRRWGIFDSGGFLVTEGATPREAIDAAIRKERKP
jgi:hypothetical protein